MCRKNSLATYKLPFCRLFFVFVVKKGFKEEAATVLATGSFSL